MMMMASLRYTRLPRQHVQIGAELLEIRRQLEALLQLLLVHLAFAHVRMERRHDGLRIDTMLPQDRSGDSVFIFEQRGKEVGGVDRWSSRASGAEQSQSTYELGGGPHAQLAGCQGVLGTEMVVHGGGRHGGSR